MLLSHDQQENTLSDIDKSEGMVYNIFSTRCSTLPSFIQGGVKVSTGVLKCDKRAENGVISITCATFKYKRKK